MPTTRTLTLPDVDALDVHTLTTDGDTLAVTDTLELRLIVEHDPDADVFDDGDHFGALAYVRTNRCTGQDEPRPDGFDGRARKINYGNNDGTVWWQPPADVTDPDDLESIRSWLWDRLTYGYLVVGLELCDAETDAAGQHYVHAQHWIGGVDEFYSDLVRDLADEIWHDVTTNLGAEIVERAEQASASLSGPEGRAEPTGELCRHCHRSIVNVDGAWVDPEATGDDHVWRETCDAHDTFTADHEPTMGD